MHDANWANASSSVTGAGPASTGGAPASATPPEELPLLLPVLDPPELEVLPLLEPVELPPLLLLAAALPPLLPLLAVPPW
jgi:hypothetical protein